MKKSNLLWLGGLSVLILMLISSSTFADTSIFTIPSKDMSYQFLLRIFGDVTSYDTNTLLSSMFRAFNLVVLAVGTVLLIYVYVMSLVNTAHSGTPLGQKWHTVYMPLRIVFAMGLLVPMSNGYNAAQMMMWWSIKQGIGAADYVWGSAIDYIEKYDIAPPTDVGNDGRDSVKNPDLQNTNFAKTMAGNLLFQLANKQVCMDAMNNHGYYKSGDLSPVTMHALFDAHSDPNKARYYLIYGSSEQYSANDLGNAECGYIDLSNFVSVGKFAPEANKQPAIIKSSGDALIQRFIAPSFQSNGGILAKDDSEYNSDYQNLMSYTRKIGEGYFGTVKDITAGGLTEEREAELTNLARDLQVIGLSMGAVMNTTMRAYIEQNSPKYNDNDPVKTPDSDCIKSLGLGKCTYQSIKDSGWLMAGTFFHKILQLRYPDPSTNPGKSVPEYTQFFDVNGINVTEPNSDEFEEYKIKDYMDVIAYLNTKYPFKRNFDSGSGDDGKKDLRGVSIDFGNMTPDYGIPGIDKGFKLLKPENCKGGFLGFGNALTPKCFIPAALEIVAGTVGWVIAEPLWASVRGLINAILSTYTEDFYQLVNLYNSSGPLYGTNVKFYQINPILAISKMGHSAMYKIELTFLKLFSALLPALFVGGMGAAGFLTIGFAAIALPLYATAAILAIYVPLIPFLIFIMGVLGWLMMVFEAILAAPIVMFGLLYPDGQHELFGKSEVALWITMNVVLRPILMIFGLVAAMFISQYILYAFNLSFGILFNSVISSRAVLPADLINLITEKRPIVLPYGSVVIFIAIYTLTIISIMQKTFELITMVPDRLMRWIGGEHASPINGGEVLQSAHRGGAGMGGVISSATTSLGLGGSAAGGKAAYGAAKNKFGSKGGGGTGGGK